MVTLPVAKFGAWAVADSRNLFLATSPPRGQYSAERMIII
jgi:hypothetical protein